MKLSAKIWVFGFLIACFALSFSSCRRLRLHTERNSEEKTVYVEVLRDTIIQIPPDSSALVALFECDSLNRVVLKELSELQGARSFVNTRLKSSEDKMYVYVDCVCDSLDIYMQYKERYYTHTTNETELTKEVTQETNKPVKKNWFIAGSIVGLITCFTVWLIYTLFKYKLRLWRK